MAKIAFDNGPAFVTWQNVVRGDDETVDLYFAEPGGYTITNLGDGAEDVTLTDPIDMTGTYTFSVALTRGDTPLFTGSVDTTSAATGILTLSMTDTQTALLTTPQAVWDLVQVVGSTRETLIVGTMNVLEGVSQ